MVGTFKFPIVFGNPKWKGSIFSERLGGPNFVPQVGVNGNVYLNAAYVERPMTFSRIDTAIQVLGGVGTHLRLGLYADNGGTPVGGALLFDSGDIAADSNAKKDTPISPGVAVPMGLVWAALETNDATIKFAAHNNNSTWTDQGTEALNSCFFNQVYGALPNPCPAVTINEFNRWIFYLRIAAIA